MGMVPTSPKPWPRSRRRWVAKVERCPATTQENVPCKVTHGLNPETGLCRWHDPSRRDELLVSARKGGLTARAKGRARSPLTKPPETAAEVKRLVTWAMFEVSRHNLPAPQAGAIGRLGSIALKAIETADLERQLRDAKKALERLQTQRGGKR